MERFFESILTGKASAHSEATHQQFQAIIEEIKGFADQQSELQAFSDCLFDTLRKYSKYYGELVVK